MKSKAMRTTSADSKLMRSRASLVALGLLCLAALVVLTMSCTNVSSKSMHAAASSSGAGSLAQRELRAPVGAADESLSGVAPSSRQLNLGRRAELDAHSGTMYDLIKPGRTRADVSSPRSSTSNFASKAPDPSSALQADAGDRRLGERERPAEDGARTTTRQNVTVDDLTLTERRYPSMALAPGEELWVISPLEPDADDRADAEADRPRSGAMRARRMPPGDGADGRESAEVLDMPLQSTAVEADIDGYLSAVNVRQRFANPYDVKIEAEYVFPLPQDAAVHDFVMTIGERRIRGVIRPREEAQRIYAEARSRGHRASLMNQERPNIFTQKVANIEPGESIDLDITYFHTLPYRDDAFEFVFPMTVGPRFNPPGATDPVHARPSDHVAEPGEPGTTVTYLSPDEETPHRVSVEVDVDARFPIEFVRSMNHVVDVERTGSTTARVTLRRDSVANRDFVLRIGVDRSRLASATLITPDRAGAFAGAGVAGGEGAGSVDRGTFSVMLMPPSDFSQSSARTPVEFIFVIDTSGSMSGPHMEAARKAMRRAVRSLDERDSFNVVRFAGSAGSLFANPQPANDRNLREAVRWIDALRAGGGTRAVEGIRAALEPDRDAERQRLVLFFTDGFIGSESEVLAVIHEHLQDGRVFSVGVGSAPNRYLIERMAKLGRGAVAFLGQQDSPASLVDAFFERVSRPVMADVRVDFGPGVTASAVYPSRNLDVLAGRPLIVTGRYEGELPDSVRVTGNMAGRVVTLEAPVQRHEEVARAHPALPTMWARTAIADMMDAMAFAADETLPDRIEALAMTSNLVSAYTSFVAVDALEITEGEFGVKVKQPVHVPEGVRYDTTVVGSPPRR